MNFSVFTPGTIVCANYRDFNGVERVGIFCIIYDEQLDPSMNYKKNVLGVKVTTSLGLCTNYCVALNDGFNNFFDKDCLALCSKPHVLEKEACYKVIGVLSRTTFKKVYKEYKQFERELERQMLDYI